MSLFDDIKAGVARVKKMKAEQKGQNNYGNKGIGKTKYSLERPPQVFIRRAVDSSDEEEGSSPRQKHGNRKRYK